MSRPLIRALLSEHLRLTRVPYIFSWHVQCPKASGFSVGSVGAAGLALADQTDDYTVEGRIRSPPGGDM